MNSQGSSSPCARGRRGARRCGSAARSDRRRSPPGRQQRDRLGDRLRAFHLPKHWPSSSSRPGSTRRTRPTPPARCARRSVRGSGSRMAATTASIETTPVRRRSRRAARRSGAAARDARARSRSPAASSPARAGSARSTSPRPSSSKPFPRVDQDVAVGRRARRRRRPGAAASGPGRSDASGSGDRLAGPDRLVVDAAEGHHGGTGALGAEGREGLCVAPLLERGDRRAARPRSRRPGHRARGCAPGTRDPVRTAASAGREHPAEIGAHDHQAGTTAIRADPWSL